MVVNTVFPLSVVNRQGVKPPITRSRAKASRRKKCLLRPLGQSWEAELPSISVPAPAGVEARPWRVFCVCGLWSSLSVFAAPDHGIRPAGNIVNEA